MKSLVFVVFMVVILAMMVFPAFAEDAESWTTKAPMSSERYLHQLAVLNGNIYAIGGNIGSSTLGSVEAYDPANNTWTTRTPMNNPRQ